jgi:putative ABC transport system ATP-binding protein
VLLSLAGVSKEFRRGDARLRVLDDVSLTVDAGEVVAVVAVRGQGKSTLLRVAAGLQDPDGGRVLLDGEDLARVRERELARLLRKQIGVAGRDGPRLRVPVLEYVALRALIGAGRRRDRREVHALAHAALARVGVPAARAGERWESLSALDRALVEIAQATVTGPRLLLVDDVTDGLSARESERVAALLRALARERRMGVLMGCSGGEVALAACRVHGLARGVLSLISDPARHERGGPGRALRTGTGGGPRRGRQVAHY